MNEENISDSSFVNYLIDNVNQALIDTEADLEDYLKEIREKLMKNYIKELKKTEKKESAMNLFKNLAKMLKKNSTRDHGTESKKEESKKQEEASNLNDSEDVLMRNETQDTMLGLMRDNSFNRVIGSFDPKMSLFKPKKLTDLNPGQHSLTPNPKTALQDNFFPGDRDSVKSEENTLMPNLFGKGLTKLAEINSVDMEGSHRKIEMYYKSPELGEQESRGEGSAYKYPEMTSIVSQELSLKKSEKNINLDLISLPDQKDYLGSWRILLELQKNDFFQNKINAKFHNSDRHINRKNLGAFLEDLDAPPQLASNHVIKIVATHANEDQSHGSWLYSDSSASQTMKVNVMGNQGKSQPIMDAQQLEFYKELYEDILRVERGEKTVIGDQFPLDYNPQEAMVMLNESFKIGESLPPSEDESADHLHHLDTNRKTSAFAKDGFIPKMTLRGYTRKITKQPTMFSRNSSATDDKSRKKSRQNVEKRASRTNPTDRKGSMLSNLNFKSQYKSEHNGPKSEHKGERSVDNDAYSLSGKSENIMQMESDHEEDDRVKVVINLSREIWMSLRMAPVLSYAPQIKENIEALGFKIKFIEDLVLMNEEYKDMIQRKVEQMNKNSVNNLRISKFNKMGLRKQITVDPRNLPSDQRGFGTDHSTTNLVSLDSKTNPLNQMDRFRNESDPQSFRIVSYYHVNNSNKEGSNSYRYKDCSNKHAHSHANHKHVAQESTLYSTNDRKRTDLRSKHDKRARP